MIILSISPRSTSDQSKRGDFGNLMLRKISKLESRSGIKLNMKQKILLIEIGTVEQMLSIITCSPVRVKVVDQKENKGIITRESVIITRDTKDIFVHAISQIFTSNLPPTIIRKIKRKRVGIGTIIHDLHLETFRRIIEIGYEPKSRLLFRRYQIIYKKKVAFEIREELPYLIQ